jgi:tetraacyldisaccharide 4'-kinase
MALLEGPRRSAAHWVPTWWAGDAGAGGAVLSTLLWPAERAYAGVVALRNSAYDRGWLESRAAPIPVVSIGNAGVGGTGKTPFAAWVAAHFEGKGLRSCVVLRGYGRDEILVHRELNPSVPVFADADRVRAVGMAAREGREVAVIDDGFQHRRLRRDLDILLVSAETMAFSRRLLPRGPWREPLAAARRADLLVLTRKSAGPAEAERAQTDLERITGCREIVRCSIEPSRLEPLHTGSPAPVESLRGESVLAVAALAWPEPFAENLRRAGARVELAAFPDHHEFTEPECDALIRRAAGRTLVMTLKDAVKLRPLIDDAHPALVLHQRVGFDAGGDLIEAALQRIAERSAR